MSLLFWRKPKLPAARRPALEPDERILAWAATPREQVLVATNRGLWLPADSGRPDTSTRLAWDRIHKATWTGRDLVIVASAVVASLDTYEVTADLAPIVQSLPNPGDLPAQVRARVTKSVAYSTRHPLPGGGAARVVARRRPGVDGLHWTVRLEGGADIDDPVVREVTNGLVEAAGAEIGQ